jgi:tetratricopeptide (TPR) repeat protein
MITASHYIQLAPKESNPYDTRAEVLGFNGRLDLALASYREAVAREPVLPQSLQRAGILYLFKQDYDNARRLFDRLEDFTADNPWIDPYVYYANIPLRQGKWREALACLDRGIAHDSGDSDRALHVAYKHQFKALINLDLGRDAEALQEMEMALPALKGVSWFWHGMDEDILYGWILARNRKFSEAEQVIAPRLSQRTEKDHVRRMRYLVARGLVALECGDLDGAAELLEDADSVKTRWLSREHFVLQGMLARVSLKLGRFDRAVELLEESLGVYAESRAWQMLLDVRNHFYLGEAYERSGWQKKAAEQYRTFLDIWEDADDGLPEIAEAARRLAKLSAE